jgi:hypothetical protein
VQDRDKANYCTWFKPGEGPKKMSREATAARRKLDALFKK